MVQDRIMVTIEHWYEVLYDFVIEWNKKSELMLTRRATASV